MSLRRHLIITSEVTSHLLVLCLALLPCTLEIETGVDEKNRCWDPTEKQWRRQYEEWYSRDCKQNCSCEHNSRGGGGGHGGSDVLLAAACSPIRCRHQWEDKCPDGQKARRVNCCNECTAIDRKPPLVTWRYVAPKINTTHTVCQLTQPCQVAPLREHDAQTCVNAIRLPPSLVCPERSCSILCAGRQACFLPQMRGDARIKWLMPGEVWSKPQCGICICAEGNLRCHNHKCNTDLKRSKSKCHIEGNQIPVGLIKPMVDLQQNHTCRFCMCNGTMLSCRQFSSTSSVCHQNRKQDIDENLNDSVNFQQSNLVMVLILLTVLFICLILSGSLILFYVIKLRRKNIHSNMKNKANHDLTTKVLLNSHNYSTSVMITM